MPGLDKLLGLIKKAELRNTVVLAFVIAFCMALLIYFNGFSYLASNQMQNQVVQTPVSL